MDIVDQLHRQVHIESAAIAPQTSRTIETMKLAIEEIERSRTALAYLARIGEQGMKPDYNEWLCFHDKVAQVANAALNPSPRTQSQE